MLQLIRLVFLMVTLLLTVPGSGVLYAAALPGSSASPSADNPPPIKPEQLQALVNTLQNPADRQQLITQLQALIAAQQTQQAQQPQETPGLGARALTAISARAERVSAQMVAVGSAFLDLPQAVSWFKRQMADANIRERWARLILSLTAAILGGLAARWIARRLLRRPIAMLEQRQCQSVLTKLALLAMRLLMDLAIIAAFAIAAMSIFALGGIGDVTLMGIDKTVNPVRLAASLVILSALVVQLIMAAARLFLAPGMPGLRLPHIDNETATYGYIWVLRIACVGVTGIFASSAAAALHVPEGASDAILKITGLIVAGMLVILTLQNRHAVAGWLRGHAISGGPSDEEAALESPPAHVRQNFLRGIRRRLADIWHVLVILYIVGIYAIWALEVEGGFSYMIRSTFISLVVIVAARLLVNGLRSLLKRGFAISAELKTQFPGLEQRANRYLPILQRLVKIAVWSVAALIILAAWGLHSFEWLKTDTGKHLSASAASILLVLAIALVAWELANAVMERYLGAVDAQGRPLPRSPRVRTLMPLIRNVLLIVLITMVVLITLSELGVNIGPLLAGAGIIGVAIGFGSQTLVKDVITGLFILLEDTVVIGDVVDVGNGHSGQVAGLTIRALRLRDFAGAMHTIPFSAVTTVINLTKDFAYAVFDITVAYNTDVDKAISLIKAVGDDLRADPAFKPLIMAPLEMSGVDSFGANGIVIKSRIKTRPIQQWTVGREFNRRLRLSFAKAGIEMYLGLPALTLPDLAGQDKEADIPQEGKV